MWNQLDSLYSSCPSLSMPTTFELQSFPLDKTKNRLFLVQNPYRTERTKTVAEPTTIAKLDGVAARLAAQVLNGLLSTKVLAAADVEGFLHKEGRVALDETQALRLSLAFSVVTSMRSDEKVQQIVEGIEKMGPDDVVSWMRMVSDDSSQNGRLALQVFLTGKM